MRVHGVLFLSVVTLSVGGCNRGCAATSTANDDAGESIAEPGNDPDTQPRITFVIDSTYPNSKPADAAPWHVPGGDWTFFDAHLEGGAHFGMGIHTGTDANGFSFGKAIITVPSAADGAKIVERFAKTFHGKIPPAASTQPLHFRPFSIAVLGSNQARRSGGGFAGSGGWTATKLFLQRPGLEAEVFFNYDLAGKKGEFAEKDPDYADDMAAFLAREVRDGPRPPRAPATDPSMSAVGPKFDAWTSFGPAHATAIRFEAGGKRLLYSVADGSATKLVSASLDNASDEALVMRVEHPLGASPCAPLTDDPCVVEEQLPKKAGMWSGDDPNRLHLVDRAKKTTRVLSGPWGSKGSLPLTAPISPDGAFVGVFEWKSKASGSGSFKLLHIVAVEGGAVASANLGEESIDVVSWSGKGAALRAVVKRGNAWSKDVKISWALVDPRTGTFVEAPAAPAGSDAEAVAPGGRRRVNCDGDRDVVVTDLATSAARRFHIFEEDRHAFKDGECIGWVNARFLQYSAGRLAFLDADTMMLSYPFDEDAEPPALRYDRAFTVAASTSPDGIRVAHVVVK